MSLGKSVFFGLCCGALLALWICSIALDHNPQGEFADVKTGAYTSDLYVLFAAWTGISGICVAAILALVGVLRRLD